VEGGVAAVQLIWCSGAPGEIRKKHGKRGSREGRLGRRGGFHRCHFLRHRRELGHCHHGPGSWIGPILSHEEASPVVEKIAAYQPKSTTKMASIQRSNG